MQLLKSDASGLTLRMTLPQAHFGFRRLGGRDWSDLFLDDLSDAGKFGQPGLPMVTEQFGIPTGAGVSARLSRVSSYRLRNVSLLPYQPEPVDQQSSSDPMFLDKPFRFDAKAYRARTAPSHQPSEARRRSARCATSGSEGRASRERSTCPQPPAPRHHRLGRPRCLLRRPGDVRRRPHERLLQRDLQPPVRVGAPELHRREAEPGPNRPDLLRRGGLDRHFGPPPPRRRHD